MNRTFCFQGALLVILCLPFSLPWCRANPPCVERSILQLLNKHERYHSKKLDIKIINLFKTRESISKNTTIRTLEFFDHHRSFPQLASHMNTVCASLDKFWDVKGFCPTIKKLVVGLNQPEKLRGNLFELAMAVKISEKYKIISFNEVTRAANSVGRGREFDLKIQDSNQNECWLELKNVNWKNHISDLKRQFNDQKRIAKSHNDENVKSVEYHIVSQKSVPSLFQKWFKEKGIKYTSLEE